MDWRRENRVGKADADALEADADEKSSRKGCCRHPRGRGLRQQLARPWDTVFCDKLNVTGPWDTIFREKCNVTGPWDTVF